MRQEVKTEDEQSPDLSGEIQGRIDHQGERLAKARGEFQKAWQAKVAEKVWRVQRLREAGGFWMKRGRWCMRQALSIAVYSPLVVALGYFSKSARWGLKAFVIVIGIMGLGWAVTWMVGFGLCFAAERLRVKEIKHL